MLDILKTLLAWRRPIIALTFAAGVLTAGISLLLHNYYRSTTIFLAGNPEQFRPEVLFGKGGASAAIYGGSHDIDRVLAIAESNELIDYLVDTFQLYDHYRIDPENPKAIYKVRMKFRSLYEVKKTKLDVIELTVEDRSPELAAAMANAARERINSITQRIIKDNQWKTFNSYQQNLAHKTTELQFLGDSLATLRQKYGIFNTAEQSQTLTAQFIVSQSQYFRNKGRLEAMRVNPRIPRDSVAFAEVLVRGLEQELDSLRKNLGELNEGQIYLSILENQYYAANGQYGDDLERAKLLDATLQSEIPTLYLIERAEVPVVKSRPRRSIIVVMAGVVAFFMSVLGVLLFESYRNVNWREFFSGV